MKISETKGKLRSTKQKVKKQKTCRKKLVCHFFVLFPQYGSMFVFLLFDGWIQTVKNLSNVTEATESDRQEQSSTETQQVIVYHIRGDFKILHHAQEVANKPQIFDAWDIPCQLGAAAIRSAMQPTRCINPDLQSKDLGTKQKELYRREKRAVPIGQPRSLCALFSMSAGAPSAGP